MTEQIEQNKNEVEVLDVNQLLEDLSYSWATPEAQDFHYKVRNKNYTSAKKMLAKEGLSKAQIDVIIKYFKNQFTAKRKLIEYYPSEYENLTEKDELLVSYGGTIIATGVRKEERYTRYKGNCFYYTGEGYVPLEKAIQVWKVEIIEE